MTSPWPSPSHMAVVWANQTMLCWCDCPLLLEGDTLYFGWGGEFGDLVRRYATHATYMNRVVWRALKTPDKYVPPVALHLVGSFDV